MINQTFSFTRSPHPPHTYSPVTGGRKQDLHIEHQLFLSLSKISSVKILLLLLRSPLPAGTIVIYSFTDLFIHVLDL